jgi:hypothetical protein
MWYNSYDSDDTSNICIGYATSPDGVTWTKYSGNPVLRPGQPDSWEGQLVISPFVIVENDTLKMWYRGNDNKNVMRLGLAFSTDGINWTKYAQNPVMEIGADFFETHSIYYDGKNYIMWYYGDSRFQWDIAYASSPDGVHWTKHPVPVVFNPVYFSVLPSVVFDGTTFHLWYVSGRTAGINYAISKDGIHWTEYPYYPTFIDSLAQWGYTAVIFDGTKFHLWYDGVSGIMYATSMAFQHDIGVYASANANYNLPMLATNTIVPSPEFRNIGNARATEANIAITCQIDSSGLSIYSDSKILDSLQSWKSQEIAFSKWSTSEPFQYQIKYFIQSATDKNTANDTLKNSIQVTNLMDDFENGITRWQSDNKWVAYASAHTGKFCLKSSQANYENNVDSWAEYKHSFNLSKLNAAHISYWIRHYIETDRDFGYVEASRDGGQTWQKLGNPYTGNQGNWKEDARSLTAFCGPGFTDVRIRFRFKSDSTTVRPGLFIDDINIYPFEMQTTIAREESNPLPNEFVLYDNYPNPFNAQTLIEYQLPQSGHVKLVVYNLLGQEIKTLINKNHEAGRFNLVWDGKDNLGQAIPSSVYFYRIQAEGFAETKKMLLLMFRT